MAFRPDQAIRTAGYSLRLFAEAVGYMRRAPFRWKSVVREMWVIGVQSIPLACFFLFLIGMVFAQQTGIQLLELGQENVVGRLVAAGMVRELGPWMAAFVLVARNGSSMAAEIGTMSVSEEISALRIMAINPVDYVVMPRLLAFAIMGPVVTVIATAVGILGGLIVAWLLLGVPPRVFVDELWTGLEPALVIHWLFLKSLVFSVTAATVACAYGLRAKGGALGVGNASRDTVVWSLVLIVFFNFILTSFFHFVNTLLKGS